MLDNLPNEIILQILSSMPDLETLHNFLRSYPASQDLFVAFAKDIILLTIRQNYPLQIQKLICTDLCLRQNPTINLEIEESEEYLELHLDDEKISPRLETFTDPILALRHSVTVISDIEYHTQAFVASRQRKPGVARQLMPTQDPASRTELLRIRRGFWRLQFLCELLNIRNGISTHASPDDVMDAFSEKLTLWELEEMECVYYFLREQYEILKFPRNCEKEPKAIVLVSSQPPRAQRMLRSFGYKPGERSPLSLGLDCNGSTIEDFITNVFGWGSDLLDTPKTGTFWSDEVASNKPNEGWRYFDNHSQDVPGRWGCGDVARGPVLCFLNWGYCMWDKTRLEA